MYKFTTLAMDETLEVKGMTAIISPFSYACITIRYEICSVYDIENASHVLTVRSNTNNHEDAGNVASPSRYEPRRLVTSDPPLVLATPDSCQWSTSRASFPNFSKVTAPRNSPWSTQIGAGPGKSMRTITGLSLIDCHWRYQISLSTNEQHRSIITSNLNSINTVT